ncbi:MAG TPA: hypothetical protein VHU85_17860 [Acidimicrobiales bacterium]|jgi:hypothetical protein|nr:hypothetical protein [Acidimicrobiales bacterium]
MPTRNATRSEVQEIARILKVNRSAAMVRSLSKRFAIDESFVQAVAEEVVAERFNFESTDPAGNVFSGTGPIIERQVRVATELKATVDRAEARESLKDCTLQELEALTAVAFG